MKKSEKIEIKKEEYKKPTKVGTKTGDKVFPFKCWMCKKTVLMICRQGTHLIDNEPIEKPKMISFELGYNRCPYCKKFFLFKHREDCTHSA